MKKQLEYEEFLAVVAKHDDDGSGQLSIHEIEDLVDELLNGGEKINYKDDDPADQVMKKYDLDGNGQFEYDEVKAIITDLEEQKKVAGALVKMIFVFAIAIFALLGALMGVVLGANEGTKESHTDDSGAMVQLNGEAMMTDNVAAFVSLFDMPKVPLPDLMKTTQISFYIDFSEREDVAIGWVPATFKIAGAYSGAGVSVYVTTNEGYTIFLDNEAEAGNITLGGGKYPIDVTAPPEEARRLMDEHVAALEQSGLGPDESIFFTRKEWAKYEREFNELNYPDTLHRARRLLGEGRALAGAPSHGSTRSKLYELMGFSKKKKKAKKKKKKKKKKNMESPSSPPPVMPSPAPPATPPAELPAEPGSG